MIVFIYTQSGCELLLLSLLFLLLLMGLCFIVNLRGSFIGGSFASAM